MDIHNTTARQRDTELRDAARDWLNLWTAMQAKCDADGVYIPTDGECDTANKHMNIVLNRRAITYEGICAKAAILTALDGNSDRLALGLCSDIQRLGRS